MLTRNIYLSKEHGYILTSRSILLHVNQIYSSPYNNNAFLELNWLQLPSNINSELKYMHCFRFTPCSAQSTQLLNYLLNRELPMGVLKKYVAIFKRRQSPNCIEKKHRFCFEIHAKVLYSSYICLDMIQIFKVSHTS